MIQPFATTKIETKTVTTVEQPLTRIVEQPLTRVIEQPLPQVSTTIQPANNILEIAKQPLPIAEQPLIRVVEQQPLTRVTEQHLTRVVEQALPQVSTNIQPANNVLEIAKQPLPLVERPLIRVGDQPLPQVSINLQPVTNVVVKEEVITTKPLNTSTVGRLLVRPLQARLDLDHDIISKIAPFCDMKLGKQTDKSVVAMKTRINHAWTDVIIFDRKKKENELVIKVKDKDGEMLQSEIGAAHIPLDETLMELKITKWYPLQKLLKFVGEIEVCTEFEPLQK